ncbi:hypothetical protein, partial [Streptococcus pyogenes]|uniref:hypothetical protein n=1 Tax=Streptococcus pyogenes TaxID=1314 RepID=UPI001E62ACDD
MLYGEQKARHRQGLCGSSVLLTIRGMDAESSLHGRIHDVSAIRITAAGTQPGDDALNDHALAQRIRIQLRLAQ